MGKVGERKLREEGRIKVRRERVAKEQNRERERESLREIKQCLTCTCRASETERRTGRETSVEKRDRRRKSWIEISSSSP